MLHVNILKSENFYHYFAATRKKEVGDKDLVSLLRMTTSSSFHTGMWTRGCRRKEGKERRSRAQLPFNMQSALPIIKCYPIQVLELQPDYASYISFCVWEGSRWIIMMVRKKVHRMDLAQRGEKQFPPIEPSLLSCYRKALPLGSPYQARPHFPLWPKFYLLYKSPPTQFHPSIILLLPNSAAYLILCCLSLCHHFF